MNKPINIMQLNEPIVMGIINATPDSFYNKGRDNSLQEIEFKANKMIAEGATILDVGGMSTKPNSIEISIKEEIERAIPVIEMMRKNHSDILISIDTYRSEVAQKAIKAGANIINDISGGQLDSSIIDIAVKYNVPYICMHIQGNPRTMQMNPSYENVVDDVMNYFQERLITFSKKGLENIILDVGFGFGKTIEHNYTLLKNLSQFKKLDKPILAGLSRKSMIYKPLNSDAEHALNGTTALNMIALQQGANVLRVHDVMEAVECVKLYGFANC
jgi:dihydropteroate synthase